MPSGKTHAAITTTAAAGLLGWGVLTGQPRVITASLVGGCLIGLVLTPDLDVDEPTRSYYYVKKEAGVIVARIWYYLWMPYAKLIHHRSWLSHFPVVGTALRVGYLGVIAWVVLFIFGRPWPWVQLPGWAPWLLLGLGVSDGLHWVADVSWTRVKRMFRRKRRRW